MSGPKATFKTIDHKVVSGATVSPAGSGDEVALLVAAMGEITQALRSLKLEAHMAPITVEVPDFDIPAPTVSVAAPSVEVKPTFTIPDSQPNIVIQAVYPLVPLLIIGVANVAALIGMVAIYLVRH